MNRVNPSEQAQYDRVNPGQHSAMMSDLSESQIGHVCAHNEPGKFFSTRVNLVNRVNPSEQAHYDRVLGQFGLV